MNAVAAKLTEILGDEAVSLEEDDRRAHVTDAWPALRKWSSEQVGARLPSCVVRPGSTEEVASVVRAAGELGVPIVPYGKGSGVVGALVPSASGSISLDTSRLDRIVELDEESLTVYAEAGVLGSDLEAYLRERGYTLGHYPQSLYLGSVGGWVATRAIGTFSNKYGGIEDLLSSLTAVLPTGEVISTKNTPRSATGLRVSDLFLGTEGALGVVCRVGLRVLPSPESRVFTAVTFSSVDSGLDAVRAMYRAHLRPAVLRLYDEVEAETVLGAGRPTLIIGCEGAAALTSVELALASQISLQHGGSELGPELGERWEQHRFDASWLDRGNATATLMADAIEVSGTWPVLRRIDESLRDAVGPLAQRLMSHWSHFYPQGGCAYYIVFVEGASSEETVRRYGQVWEAAMHAVLDAGGSIAHHHGVGLARHEYLRADAGTSYVVWERVKSALDPRNTMNPGKLGL